MKHFVLFQARRPDDPMAVHEQDCVQKGLGLTTHEMTIWNLVNSGPPVQLLDEADAYLIGGSGAFHVFDDHPWLHRTIDLCRHHFAKGEKPFLGLCFGHQLLATAAGGRVVNDPEKEEVGTFEVELTTSGMKDPLFADMPPRFLAQLGHSDRVSELPKGWHNLAFSQRVDLQAYRAGERPVWGVQFHPELERQDNILRFRSYAEHYGLPKGKPLPPETMARFQDSPLPQRILKSFANVVRGDEP